MSSGGGGSSYNPEQGRLENARAEEASRVKNAGQMMAQSATNRLLAPGRTILMSDYEGMNTAAQDALMTQIGDNETRKAGREAAATQKRVEEAAVVAARNLAARRASFNTISRL